jgi:hypothetical protein
MREAFLPLVIKMIFCNCFVQWNEIQLFRRGQLRDCFENNLV